MVAPEREAIVWCADWLLWWVPICISLINHPCLWRRNYNTRVKIEHITVDRRYVTWLWDGIEDFCLSIDGHASLLLGKKWLYWK